MKHHPLLGGCVNSTDRQPHTQTNGRNLPPNDPSGVRTRPRSCTKHGSCLPVPPMRCGPAGKSGTGLHNQSAGANFSVQNHLYPGARGRAPFSAPRVARRNLRMCFRLIRAVSTRRATQSCIDPAFLAKPCWRLRGWPCALKDERCSDQIESRGTRCDPRRLDRLVSRTQSE